MYILYRRSLTGYLGVISIVTLWSAAETVGSAGVCTKSELVTKTRLQNVYRTYMESYRSYNYYECGYYSCLLHRERGHYVNEEEVYTTVETKQFCCPGYIPCTSEHICTCQPVCHLDCYNGNCTAPDTCTCWSGYNKRVGTENICEPVCNQNCTNGYCSQPETCTCDLGYQLDHSNPYTCQPVCLTPCVNANCTSPEVCTCFTGYEKIFSDPHKCHPVCSKPCHNAACIAPDSCSCFLGYQKDPNIQNICNPVCSDGCTNGICIKPNVCSCLEGHTLQDNNHTCQPMCSNCSNAFCSAPEVCSCFPGYRKFNKDDSVCFPVCSPGCTNGNCTAPDSCECFDGYEISEDPMVCKPFCSDGCLNGVCTAPEECSCLWGFSIKPNTSLCSQSKTKNLDCSFMDTFEITEFDRSCLNISMDFQLNYLQGCEIFKEIITDIEQKGTDISLIIIYCDPVFTLKYVKSTIYLDLLCKFTVNAEDHTRIDTKVSDFTTEELWSTTEYLLESFTETSDTSQSPETTESVETTVSTKETIHQFQLSTDNNSQSSDEETFKSLETTESVEIMVSTKETIHQFQLSTDNNSRSSDEVWSSVHHLELKITVQFQPFIKKNEITQGYFDNLNSTRMTNWCLCQSKKTWSICADMQTQFVLCPCRSKEIQFVSGERPLSTFIMKALVVVVMCGILLALAAWYQRDKFRYIGNYYAAFTGNS